MVATGYDVRKVHDPLWIDTIFARFPYDIIKTAMQSTDTSTLTVEQLLDVLDTEITSKLVFENRYSFLTQRRFIRSEATAYVDTGAMHCLFCQRNNHHIRNCRTNQGEKSAPAPKTSYRNPSSATALFETSEAEQQEQNKDKCSSDTVAFSNQIVTKTGNAQLVLMTAEAQIKNNTTGMFENILLFLDSGAQCNLIQTDMANTLALEKGSPYQCTMHGIGGITETYTSYESKATFKTKFGDYLTLTLNTKPVLTNAFPAATLTPNDTQFLRNNNIFLSNTFTNGELLKPPVLIGIESYAAVVLLHSPPVKLPSGLFAQNTVFGPALFGKVDASVQNYHSHVMLSCPHTVADIKQELKDMYELDGMGITLNEYKSNDTAYDYLRSYAKQILIKDGYITAPFPLKDNAIDLEDNYNVAIGRLKALFKYNEANPPKKVVHQDT
ncbi:hypothetical protein OESDEN_00760 [Oesophagostomum dentatum]|uniref:Peptidase A2 domain-containing protein n=1 Tax=Oesophagostomum dentatum TaxID=61180 RepID=A0A0B1TNZ1_OESDE|nr:hypothetical protein OESDEN_00760 [Oesophagostomum dentatum]